MADKKINLASTKDYFRIVDFRISLWARNKPQLWSKIYSNKVKKANNEPEDMQVLLDAVLTDFIENNITECSFFLNSEYF